MKGSYVMFVRTKDDFLLQGVRNYTGYLPRMHELVQLPRVGHPSILHDNYRVVEVIHSPMGEGSWTKVILTEVIARAPR